MKLLRILGKRGRITIPYEIRQRIGFSYNDVLSFEDKGNTVIVRREKLCDDCKSLHAAHEKDLLRFLDDLSPMEQQSALAYLSSLLSARWTI